MRLAESIVVRSIVLGDAANNLSFVAKNKPAPKFLFLTAKFKEPFSLRVPTLVLIFPL